MRAPFALTATAAIVAAAIAGGAAGAATPSAMRDFPAQNFTQVDLRAAATVAIHSGTGFSVHADGDPALVDRLTASVREGVLVLDWTPGPSIHNNNRHLAVTITMPRTTSVALGGAGSITLDHGSGPAFGANVGGAGSIKVASIDAARTVLSMGGAGNIVVAGNTGTLQADSSGVGSIDARALIAKSGRVSMSGTGHVAATIDGPADASLSGVGHITIDGHPICTVHKSGLGSIRCG